MSCPFCTSCQPVEVSCIRTKALGSAVARTAARVSWRVLIWPPLYGLSRVVVTLMAWFIGADRTPSALRTLAGAQAVMYTAPVLPTSAALKLTVVVMVALVAVMSLMVVATKGTGLKVAMTSLAASMVTTHEPVPLHAPRHPAKKLPVDGVAVRVTWVPLV